MLLLFSFLAGCGREEIRVYRAPKEKPPTAVTAADSHEHAPRSFPKLDWRLPAGWEERGAGRMSIASFWIPGNDGQGAEVSVMPMPGESASNLSLLVNIVRQSAGMKPMGDEEIAKLAETVQIGEANARLVDLSGATASSEESQTNQIVLVVFPRAGTTWFFKMAGHATLVASQKTAFLDFLKSIKFQEAAGPAAVAGNPSSSGAVGVSSGAPQAKPQWAVPQTWQEVPPTEFLLAKFLLTGQANAKAEVTVSVFGGSAGGIAGNVNRWRRQLALPELAEAEASKQGSALDLAEGQAMVFDMNGQDAKSGRKARLIGVIYPQGGQTWFYKLMGDEAVAEQEKAAFLKFVQTAKHPNGA